jgi:hypothetical protein
MKARIGHGWLVEGASEPDEDSLGRWREDHPGFTEWTREWFDRECAAGLIADDTDGFCGGGSLLLFSARVYASKYAKRDAALASGLRSIESVYFLEFLLDSGEDLSDLLASWEQECQAFHSGYCAAFPTKGIYVFRTLEDAEGALQNVQDVGLP